MNDAVKPLPRDDRDFKVGQIIGAQRKPRRFRLKTFPHKNQGNSDKCTAYASCTASEIQEKVELNPDWVFAKSKEMSGDVDSWGQDLRTIAKTHQKHGAPEQSVVEIPEEDRHIENWNDYTEEAVKHRKKSYFRVHSFEEIKDTIWKLRDAPFFGIEWGWGFDQARIYESKKGKGHAVAIVGWEGEYLIIQNSYGKQAGYNGDFFIHKDVVEKGIERFGCYVFVDLSPEDAKYYIDNGIQLNDDWIKQALKAVVTILQDIIRRLGYGKQ